MSTPVPMLVPAVLAALLATAPAGAHETRIMIKTPVKAAPSSTAETIGLQSPFRRVEVTECTGRGTRGYCYTIAPGPDGWAAASALEHPRPPALPCPPNCRPHT
jgi:hypothetical protein